MGDLHYCTSSKHDPPTIIYFILNCIPLQDASYCVLFLHVQTIVRKRWYLNIPAEFLSCTRCNRLLQSVYGVPHPSNEQKNQTRKPILHKNHCVLSSIHI